MPKPYAYITAVNQACLDAVRQVIETFGFEAFDFYIFIYDDTRVDDDPLFSRCQVIYDRLPGKWGFCKKYLTPELLSAYRYVLCWDCDMDVSDFNSRRFLDLLAQHDIEVGAPALSHTSYYSYPITLHDKSVETGRYTSFIEVGLPVIAGRVIPKYWAMLQPDYNFMGWGYGLLTMGYCRLTRLAIIDAETVTHFKPIESHQRPDVIDDGLRFLLSHVRYPIIPPGKCFGEVGQISHAELAAKVQAALREQSDWLHVLRRATLLLKQWLWRFLTSRFRFCRPAYRFVTRQP